LGCAAYSFDENSKVCQFGRRFKVEVSSINGNGTMTIFTLPGSISCYFFKLSRLAFFFKEKCQTLPRDPFPHYYLKSDCLSASISSHSFEERGLKLGRNNPHMNDQMKLK